MINKYPIKIVSIPHLPDIKSPKAAHLVGAYTSEVDKHELLPGEIEATSNFSSKRLAEFKAGRACAHNLLQTMGYDTFPIRIGDARQPIWPDQVVGSISHAGDAAVSVVAPKRAIKGIGIDLELREIETFDLLSMVVSADEQLALPGMLDKCDYLGKLLFSAKESVFKCQFPLTLNWLEFSQVSLSLDFAKREFTTTVRNQTVPLSITGTWGISESYVFTLAWIV